MEKILTDLSHTSLVHATKGNLNAFFLKLGDSPAIEFEKRIGFSRWYSKVPYPWFSGVLCGHPATPADVSYIDKAKSYFKSHGVDTFTWWLEPDVPRESWETVLIPHGFHFSDDTPGMAVDLSKLNEDIDSPAGLEIQNADSDADLVTWSKIFITGYGLPPSWIPLMYEFMAGLGLDLPVRNYLAYLDGKTVAASTLFCGAGVAGIYCVATLEEARGKGVGAAITLKPLIDARTLGYQAGVLQSSEMGYNIYKKIGFEHVCQIEHFYCSLG